MLPMILSLSLALSAPPNPPEGGEKVMLWPEKAPLAVGDSQFDKPLVTVFLAPKETATGAAVVVCPGGGYGALATDHEGKQVAEYFNQLGVHAFVLQYRIVRKDRPGPLGNAPMLDVQRAIRYVRANAEKYGIDTKRIGLMGFSAGGHLASTGGTHFDDGKADSEDSIEQASCRPDFLILAYPVISMELGTTHGGSRRNLIGEKPTEDQVLYFSNEKQVTAKTPPTFIFQTDEDKAVPAENAVGFYLACRKHKVPVEMHIYQSGQHGVGMNPKTKSTATNEWQKLLTHWLKERGVLSSME